MLNSPGHIQPLKVKKGLYTRAEAFKRFKWRQLQCIFHVLCFCNDLLVLPAIAFPPSVIVVVNLN
jgi:hypothetical protein